MQTLISVLQREICVFGGGVVEVRWILRKISQAHVKSGSGTPNTKKVGKVTRAQLEEIATTKMPDLTAADMDAAVRTIAGSARAAGIETEGVV